MVGSVRSVTLIGMTYNLKNPEPGGPHPWPGRRRLLAEQLRRAGADIVGTQEGHYGQLHDIVADSDRYAWIGTGRDGGGRGEQAAILYDPSVATPLEQGHFWLSDTPDVPGSLGTGWGTYMPRMVSWARFRLTGGSELTWLNTHLDHESPEARRRGATLIAKRVDAIAGETATVLSGDFNAAVHSDAYRILAEAGFTDAWTATGAAEHGTYGGWQAPKPDGDRIDWLLTRGPIRAAHTQLGDLHDGARWPSDHVPVRAELTVDTPAR